MCTSNNSAVGELIAEKVKHDVYNPFIAILVETLNAQMCFKIDQFTKLNVQIHGSIFPWDLITILFYY